MSWRRRNEADRERAAALARRCPKCKAAPGEKCWARFDAGRVEFVHEERKR